MAQGGTRAARPGRSWLEVEREAAKQEEGRSVAQARTQAARPGRAWLGVERENKSSRACDEPARLEYNAARTLLNRASPMVCILL